MFCLHFSHNLPIAARSKTVKLELKLKLLFMNCYLSTTFLKLRMEDGAGSNDYSELCMIAVLFSFFSLSTALCPLPPSEVNSR